MGLVVGLSVFGCVVVIMGGGIGIGVLIVEWYVVEGVYVVVVGC